MERILRRILVLSVLCMVAYGIYFEFGRAPPQQQQETTVSIDPALGSQSPAPRAP